MTSFLNISFSNHCLIITKVKKPKERIYYINKSFVDYVIHDFNKPMGVSSYNFGTSTDMSEKLRKALPDVEELRKLLDETN